jgi:hypothetical protein
VVWSIEGHLNICRIVANIQQFPRAGRSWPSVSLPGEMRKSFGGRALIVKASQESFDGRRNLPKDVKSFPLNCFLFLKTHMDTKLGVVDTRRLPSLLPSKPG